VRNKFAKKWILEHYGKKLIFHKVFLENYFRFSIMDILKMSFFQKPSDFLKEKNQYILFLSRILVADS
jgi:hypothetical protein